MGNKTTKLGPKTIKQLQTVMGGELTNEEIKAWYTEFQNSLTNGNTHLSKEDFIRVYDKLFSGDATAFAEQVFRSFDTNKNGSVDFQEFIVGLCISGSSDINRKWSWAFKMYDMDEDGFITRAEMNHIIQAIFSMTGAKVPDCHGSIEQMSNSIFDALDTNGDGLISQEEFECGARTNPFIVNILECDPESF